MSSIDAAIIPIAGRGTRLAPASEFIPKCLLPLPGPDGRAYPVLWFLIEEAVQAGLQTIILVARPDHLELLGRLVERFAWPVSIRIISQPNPRGLGDAVLAGGRLLTGSRFVVMLGDHIFVSDHERDNCTAQLLRAATSRPGAWTAVTSVGIDDLCRVAAVQGRPIERNIYRLEQILEKPTAEIARAQLRTEGLDVDRFLGHFGIHVFPPEILDAIRSIEASRPSGGEVELTSAQEALIGLCPYHVLRIEGNRLDTGEVAEYVDASVALGLRSSRHETIANKLERRLKQSPRG